MLNIFPFKRGRQKLASAYSHLYEVQKQVSMCASVEPKGKTIQKSVCVFKK